MHGAVLLLRIIKSILPHAFNKLIRNNNCHRVLKTPGSPQGEHRVTRLTQLSKTNFDRRMRMGRVRRRTCEDETFSSTARVE